MSQVGRAIGRALARAATTAALMGMSGCFGGTVGCAGPVPRWEPDTRNRWQEAGSTQLDSGWSQADIGLGRQADSGSWRTGPQDSGSWDTSSRATPDVQQRTGNFPPVVGTFVVGNQTGQTRVVRVRALKPSVQVDCSAIAGSPHVALRPAHFAPAKSWLVESGRAIPLAATPGRDCTALLIDATGLPRRLVFWSHAGWPAMQLPSVTSQLQGGAGAQRHLAILAAEGEAAWTTHTALKPNLSLVDPTPPKGCALPSGEADLSWDPMIAGSHTLVDVATAPDGCSALDLLTDQGVERVYVCLPPGMMPFGGGEDLFVAAVDTGHNVLKIQGVEMLADKSHLRFGRGGDAVYFGKGDLKIANAGSCPGQHDDCETYARALALTVTLPGAAPVTLGPGDQLDLPDGATLAVVQAVDRLVWDTTCAPGGARHIETVWSKK